MRVSISPKGSETVILSPYQLDLTMPGINPFEDNSRSAMRDILQLAVIAARPPAQLRSDCGTRFGAELRGSSASFSRA